MKIFENKVGRPSNEMKMLKRTFYVSMVALAISIVAIVLSCVINVKNSASKTKGELIWEGTPDGKVSMTSSSPNGVRWEEDWSSSWYYSAREKYDIYFHVKNNTGKKLYYRYFAYYNGDLIYNSKPNNKFDSGICSTTIPSSNVQTNIKKTIRLDKYDHIRSVLVVYDSVDACKKDNDGKGTHVLSHEMYNHYSTQNPNKPASLPKFTGNSFKELLEWIIDFIKKLFGIKDSGPGTGAPKTTEATVTGWKMLEYNKSTIKSIGKQDEERNCYEFAVKYGNAIAPGKSVGGDICTGSGWDRFSLIKSKIDSGVPVILEVKTRRGNPHWITIIGYDKSTTESKISDTATESKISDKTAMLKYLYAIDPWNLNIGQANLTRPNETKPESYFSVPNNSACKTWK